MQIVPVTANMYEAYDDFLLQHPGGLFYYSSKYRRFIKSLLACDDLYLAAVERGVIQGILPLMFLETDVGIVCNSLPFYGSHGGILASNPNAREALVDAYHKIIVEKNVLSSTLVGNPFALQDCSHVMHNHLDFRIGQFTDIGCQGNHREEILKRVDSKARRDLNRPIREGILVESDHARMECLRELHEAGISALGGLPKGRRFFELVPQFFEPGKDYDLYVAKKEGQIIAALLLFYFNGVVEYFTPAVQDEYRSLQPLSLIVATAMVDASRRGFIWWNWGGTWETQAGVYHFKRKWGACDKKYYYYTQLNADFVLDWPQERILSAFPNFYVVPFSELRSRERVL